LWRHLAAGGLTNAEVRLTEGLRTLRQRRDSKGKWKSFPFYYTLLALSEMDIPQAVEEMRYAAGACERDLKRPPKNDVFNRRRRVLCERILEKC
jgi:hypothetical protein